MNRYLKLVNFELNRFIKLYLILIVLTVVSQIAAVIFFSKRYLKTANEMIYNESMSKATFLDQFGQATFSDIMMSGWFVWPITICVAALVFYVFMIWYRDWIGKNSFIYRLLMIPTERINLYFAKATAIFLMVLGLVAVQLTLLPLENRLFRLIIPIDFRLDLPISDAIPSFSYLAVLFPNSLFQFAIHYGIGFMAVFIVFTAILFERSFRLKGIIFGILYCFLAVVLFVSPFIVIILTGKSYLYPMELFYLELVLGVIITSISIMTSRFLLNKKITV